MRCFLSLSFFLRTSVSSFVWSFLIRYIIHLTIRSWSFVYIYTVCLYQKMQAQSRECYSVYSFWLKIKTLKLIVWNVKVLVYISLNIAFSHTNVSVWRKLFLILLKSQIKKLSALIYYGHCYFFALNQLSSFCTYPPRQRLGI